MRMAVVIGALGVCAAMAQEAPRAAFHHVHINAVDPAKSIQHYKRFWDGVPVKYRGVADAVMVDRSFILFTKVDAPAPSELVSAIYHIGWGGVNGPAEYEWRKREGMEFETPVTALGEQHYMYIWGPDRELIEVWTGFHHNRFGHVHLFAEDVNAAARWYMEHLNIEGPAEDRPRPEGTRADGRPRIWSSAVRTGGVTINIFEKPSEQNNWWNYGPIDKLEPSRGRCIDHLAFSLPEIEPAFERMKAEGVTIVEPIAHRPEYGFKSFFVEGPDGVLVEVVEARPLPEAVWD